MKHIKCFRVLQCLVFGPSRNFVMWGCFGFLNAVDLSGIFDKSKAGYLFVWFWWYNMAKVFFFSERKKFVYHSKTTRKSGLAIFGARVTVKTVWWCMGQCNWMWMRSNTHSSFETTWLQMLSFLLCCCWNFFKASRTLHNLAHRNPTRSSGRQQPWGVQEF